MGLAMGVAILGVAAVSFGASPAPPGRMRVAVTSGSRVRNGGLFKGRPIQSDTIEVDRRSGPTYKFLYHCCTQPIQVRGRSMVGDGDTGLGLWLPTPPCWYGNNAVEVEVDGHIITREVDAHYIYSCDEQRALVGFRWDTTDATVTFVFRVPRGEVGVWLDVRVVPKRKLGGVQLVLRCFPGASTAVHRLGSHRWVVTASGREATVQSTVAHGKHTNQPRRRLDLRLQDDVWVLYADKLFDREYTRRGGPCSLVILPDGVRRVRVDVGSYEVWTRLDLVPEGGACRLALAEYPKWHNPPALVHLKQNAPAVREALARSDFDIVSACRADIRALLDACADRMPAASAALPAKVQQARLTLGAQLATLRARIGKPPITFADLARTRGEAHDLLTAVTRLALDVWTAH